MANCVEEVLKAMNPEDAARFKRDVESIVDALSKEKKKAFIDGIYNPDSAFREKAQGMLERYRSDLAVETLRKQDTLLKRANLQSKIDDAVGTAVGDTVGKAYDSISTALVGSMKRVEDARASVFARGKANMANMMAGLTEQLDKSGMMKIAESGAIDKEVRMELSELNKREGGKPGLTNNPEALQLAKIYQQSYKQGLGMLNSSGAFVRELDGYAGKVTHNAEKLAKVGINEWASDMMRLLDTDKTFNSGLVPIHPVSMLETAFKDIQDGVSSRSLANEGADQLFRIVDTPANVAKRAERSRVFFFKDAASEHEYLQKYGNGKGMLDDVNSFLKKSGKDSAYMQVFGSNPEASVEGMMKANGISRASSPHEWTSLQNQLSELRGDTLRPGQNVLANVSYGARALQTMSKLGVYLANIPSHLGLRVQTLFNARYEGGVGSAVTTAAGAWADSISSTFQTLTPSARKEIAYLTGVGIESYHGEMLHQAGGGTGVQGVVSKMLNVYSKLSGLGPGISINEQASARVLAAEMGMHAGNSSFEQLPRGFAENMKRYGLGETEWKAISAIKAQAEDGRHYVSFGDLTRLSKDDALALANKAGVIPEGISSVRAQRMADQFINETATKLGTYYSDGAGVAMTAPGAYERSILLRGTHQGTWSGEALRLLTQFKAFPTSVVTQNIADTLYAGGAQSLKEAVNPLSGKFNFGGVGMMMANTTTMGILGLWMHDVMTNKKPRELDAKMIAGAMVKGGTMGIYGDYLLGDYNKRIGRGFLSAAAGPSVGQLDDIADFKSEPSKTGALRLVTNNLPGANLFYVKFALEYSYLYHLNEKLNPGYIGRMEARMKKQGTGFIMKPKR